MTPARETVRAARAWLPGGLAHDVAIELDGARVVAVREGRRGDGLPLPGLLLPGLINAHTHAELHDRRPAPDRPGFLPWVDALFATVGDRAAAIDQAGAELAAAGTAWVGDVCNAGDAGPGLAAHGLLGVIHHEVLGMEPEGAAALAAWAAGCARERVEPFTVRPAPHALFSTRAELVRAAIGAGPDDLPASLHVGESEDELQFLMTGEGPHAALLDRLGRRWRPWAPPGCSPLDALDRLGALGPRVLLVHGVRLGPAERALAARRGARLCLCVRSNLTIGGAAPDVAAWLGAGVPICLGTDSRASSPDVDVLGEIPALAALAPDVPPDRWLALATHAGAAAAGAVGFGAIRPGARPGLLHLPEVESPAALTRRAPDVRRWLVRPAASLRSDLEPS